MNQLIFLQAVDVEDKLTEFEKLWEKYSPLAVDFLIKLVLSVVVYFIGKKILKFILSLVRRGFERAKVDAGVANFTNSVLKALGYFLILNIVAYIMGIPTTSFIAVLGSAGLTIGLALQGSLSNFAGGVLILLLKPFRVGDYIISGSEEGTVTAVDIFYTKILTSDNKVVVLPNGALSNSNITNVTNEPVRRLDVIIPIGYEDDIRAVKESLWNVVLKNEWILQDQSRDIFVNGLGTEGIEITIRVWVAKENFLKTKSDLLETIKYMFDEKGYTIQFRKTEMIVRN